MHRLTLRRHLPRKAKQILNDYARTLRLLQDHAQFFLRGFRNFFILEQQVGEAYDGSQRVIDFVCHAGNQLAKRGHFFGVHQFGVQVGRIGDVGHHDYNAVDVALLVAHRA